MGSNPTLSAIAADFPEAIPLSPAPAERQQTPTPGEEIGGFLVGERLHAGALGAIYRASPGAGRPPLPFPVILKTPRAGRGDGGEGLLGFRTETMVLPILSGPYVPRFVAAGDIATAPFLAMEWIEGESLEHRLKNGPLEFGLAAQIGASLADALHSLHRQQAIHFDLKPANVILRPSGGVVLIDFGMAHHARLPDLLAEEKRFAGGSAPYVSPEQVLGSRLDPRSDLFALGALLYEMATGRLPFGAPQTLAGLRDRLWLDPVPPRLLVPALPRWYQEVTLHCLEPEAERRYQSAAHVAFDLRHPEQVTVTERGRKIERAGVLEHARRWWTARERRVAPPPPAAEIRSPDARVIMVAVDTMHPEDERHPVLRAATSRVLAMSAEYRLICVSVVRGERVVAVSGEDGRAPGIHMEHLIRLREWVRPLRLAESRLSLHVLEALNPSGTLLDFARSNLVDVIIIGAPHADQQALAWWRSIASSVTANAHCSVYVVRTPDEMQRQATPGSA